MKRIACMALVALMLLAAVPSLAEGRNILVESNGPGSTMIPFGLQGFIGTMKLYPNPADLAAYLASDGANQQGAGDKDVPVVEVKVEKKKVEIEPVQPLEV